NSKFLPINTEEFFERFKDDLHSRTNKVLFLERLTKLAEVGAISIDADLLVTNENVFSIPI
ncbi:MAG: hypothetical protein ACKO96_03695, partial [Flammeovirgaceae bacterium]